MSLVKNQQFHKLVAAEQSLELKQEKILIKNFLHRRFQDNISVTVKFLFFLFDENPTKFSHLPEHSTNNARKERFLKKKRLIGWRFRTRGPRKKKIVSILTSFFSNDWTTTFWMIFIKNECSKDWKGILKIINAEHEPKFRLILILVWKHKYKTSLKQN